MFFDTGLSDDSQPTGLQIMGAGQLLLDRALSLFHRQKNFAFRRRVWMFLTRRSTRLRSFDERWPGPGRRFQLLPLKRILSANTRL
jgi:hypothetical protein